MVVSLRSGFLSRGLGLVLLGLSLWAGGARAEAETAAAVPQVIWQAIAAGNPVKQKDWAFTQTVVSGDVRMVVRFDPRGEAKDGWTLVSPVGDAITKEIREGFEKLKETNEKDAPLGYRKLSDTIGGTIELINDTPQSRTYRYRPQPAAHDDDLSRKVKKHLNGELTIVLDGPNGPWLREIRIYATDDFKPNLMARIDSFNQHATYRLFEGLPILDAATTKVSGSAFFSSFNEDVTVKVSDVEMLEEGTAPAVMSE